MTQTPKDFCVSEVSNVERAFLISVKSCCQCARESPSRLKTYSASRSQRDWNCSHLLTYSLSCWTLTSIKEYGRSRVLSGNRVSCQWNENLTSVPRLHLTRTSEVYVVSAAIEPCICNPISYRELCIRRNRQTIPASTDVSALTISKTRVDSPSQSCNCLIHVKRAC